MSLFCSGQDSLIAQSHTQVDAGSTNTLLLYFPTFDFKLAPLVGVLRESRGFADLPLRGTCTPNSEKQVLTGSSPVDFYTLGGPSPWKSLGPTDSFTSCLEYCAEGI